MQVGVDHTEISMQGMWFLQSKFAVAVPQLQGLGNATAVQQRSVRFGVAAQLTDDVVRIHFTPNSAHLRAASLAATF